MDPYSEINLFQKKIKMMKTQIGLYTRMCNGDESYSDRVYHVCRKRSVKSLQSVSVSFV
jgi:hypothetical protein